MQREWLRLLLGARLGECRLARGVTIGMGEAEVGVAHEERAGSLQAGAHHPASLTSVAGTQGKLAKLALYSVLAESYVLN